MLSGCREASPPDGASVDARVREIIAETAGWVSPGGPPLDAPLDSLTLMAIVTHIEVAFAVSFDSGEVAALLGANDFGELAGLTARKVAERRANLDETPGNESC
jgi:hypothetical protein